MKKLSTFILLMTLTISALGQKVEPYAGLEINVSNNLLLNQMKRDNNTLLATTLGIRTTRKNITVSTHVVFNTTAVFMSSDIYSTELHVNFWYTLKKFRVGVEWVNYKSAIQFDRKRWRFDGSKLSINVRYNY